MDLLKSIFFFGGGDITKKVMLLFTSTLLCIVDLIVISFILLLIFSMTNIWQVLKINTTTINVVAVGMWQRYYHLHESSPPSRPSPRVPPHPRGHHHGCRTFHQLLATSLLLSSNSLQGTRHNSAFCFDFYSGPCNFLCILVVSCPSPLDEV